MGHKRCMCSKSHIGVCNKYDNIYKGKTFTKRKGKNKRTRKNDYKDFTVD